MRRYLDSKDTVNNDGFGSFVKGRRDISSRYIFFYQDKDLKYWHRLGSPPNRIGSCNLCSKKRDAELSLERFGSGASDGGRRIATTYAAKLDGVAKTEALRTGASLVEGPMDRQTGFTVNQKKDDDEKRRQAELDGLKSGEPNSPALGCAAFREALIFLRFDIFAYATERQLVTR